MLPGFDARPNKTNFTKYVRFPNINIVLTKQPYTTGDLSFVAADGATASHGFGIKPKWFYIDLLCLVAEGGYSIGDRAPIAGNADGDTRNIGVQIINPNTSTFGYRIGSNALNSINILGKSSGAIFTVTNANWKINITAYA